MKVGLDTSIYHFTGAGVAVYVRELTMGLRNEGVEVVETAFRPWFTRRHWAIRWVDTLRYERWWLPHVFPRTMANRAVDLVHLCAPETLRTSIPQICTIHDLNAYKHPEQFSFWMARNARRAIPRAIASTDAIITVSHYVKRDILETFPDVRPDKIHVVPNAASSTLARADDVAIREVREKNGLLKPYVLCLSTIAPSKNFPRIVEAFARVTPGWDGDLVVAGARGWRHAGLEQLPFAGKIAGRIRYLGYVPDKDLAALYSGATLFCYPSLSEGFGIPVLEAMRCGTPVLTSTVTSLPEVAGDAAVLVDPYSVDDIAKGLSSLVGDESLRKQLADRGYVQARAFSWPDSARQLRAVYEHVLSNHAR